ncbi:MAG: DUF4365 domain-containing protein [Nakamurella sp.]
MLTMTAAGLPRLSPMMSTLELNGAKARYGVSYLESICSAAGVPITESRPDADVRAIDCQVEFPEGNVYVQVKCSAQRISPKAETIRWALDERWIEKWARFADPVYFLIVHIRRSPVWIDHQAASTVHYAQALWERVDASRLDKAIRVPVANQFTAATLPLWHADLLAGHGVRSAGQLT